MFLWARVSRNAATLGCNDSRLGGLATPTPVVLLVSEACGTKGDEAGWIAAEQSRGLGKDCQLSGDCLLSVFYQRGGGGGRSVADGAQRMERSGWSGAEQCGTAGQDEWPVAGCGWGGAGQAWPGESAGL